MNYCDNRIVEDYNILEERKIDKINHYPDNFTIQYLYARSYFKYAVSDELAEANKYYTGQLKKFWTNYALFEKRFDRDGIKSFGRNSNCVKYY
ncbi:MAG: hypothetical protein IPI31_03225 [Bacteroidetes bacterium]|nr:hypothetical protein [Bacteroidota bacterium]